MGIPPWKRIIVIKQSTDLNGRFIMISNINTFHYIFSSAVFIIMNSLYIINYSNNKYFKNFKLIICLFLLFILSIIIGFRGSEVGIDTKHYIVFWNDPVNSHVNELFFVALAIVSKILINHSFLFFFLVSLITNYNYLMAFYKIDKRNFCMYMAIFLSFFLFVIINISMIRQGLAMSFFVHGTVLIYKKRYHFAFLNYLLAILTHSSSIIIIMAYLLFMIISRRLSPRNTERLLIILIISASFITLSSIVSLFEHIHPLFQRAYGYLTWNIRKGLTLKYFYFLNIIIMIFYMYKLKLCKYNTRKSSEIMHYYFLFLFGICLVLFFREEEAFADRLFYYFFAFIPLFIISLNNYFIEKIIIKIIIYTGINVWFVKSYIIQYISWYITQDSIRR